MSTRNDLTLEQKINLIKQNEGGSSYRELCDKFKISIGAVYRMLSKEKENILMIMKPIWIKRLNEKLVMILVSQSMN